MEVGAEEGEVFCSYESKDEMGKERRQNPEMSLSLGFYGGQWKSSLFLFQTALTIAFLAGWSISVAAYISMHLHTGGSAGFAL